MCQSCSRMQAAHRLKYQELNIWQCTHCQSLVHFLSEPLKLDQIYNHSYFNGAEYLNYVADRSCHLDNAARKWMLLRSHFATSSVSEEVITNLSVLELGCAHGFFLNYLQQQGVKSLFGVDVSAEAIEYARENHGNFFSLNEPPADFQYNCLLMWDLWEHLSAPQETLRKYAERLPSGGFVALTTVDAASAVARLRGRSWRQIHPPSHLHYPTRKALRQTFEKMNFAVLEQKSFSPARSLEAYLRATGFPVGLLPDSLLRLPLRLNTYDTQLLIARKI